jgi:hypothetical protein
MPTRLKYGFGPHHEKQDVSADEAEVRHVELNQRSFFEKELSRGRTHIIHDRAGINRNIDIEIIENRHGAERYEPQY